MTDHRQNSVSVNLLRNALSLKESYRITDLTSHPIYFEYFRARQRNREVIRRLLNDIRWERSF